MNWATIGLDRPSLHKFTVDFARSMGWESLPEVPVENIEVMFGLVHVGDDQVFSNRCWKPLAGVLRAIPHKTTAAGSRGPKQASVPRSAAAVVIEQYPWLEATMFGSAKQQHGHSRSKTPNGAPRVGDEGDDSDIGEFNDSDVEGALDELRARREAWAGVDTAVPEFFRVSLLGGSWTAKNKGTAFDAFKGFVPAGSIADDWCVLYRLQKSSRYDITRYTERGANLCASTWCAAMHHFFCIWESQPDAAYKYTEADVRSWQPDREFLDLLPTLSVAARPRAIALVQFRP